MKNLALVGGAAYGLTGIMIGAFGAHALKAELVARESLLSFHTGARYQMIHALFLLVLGILWGQKASAWLKTAIYSCLLGTILFSGSIYLLALLDVPFLGPVTPVGGLALIVAWLGLILHLLRLDKK